MDLISSAAVLMSQLDDAGVSCPDLHVCGFVYGHIISMSVGSAWMLVRLGSDRMVDSARMVKCQGR